MFYDKFLCLQGKVTKCTQIKGSIGQFLCGKQRLIENVAVSSVRSESKCWFSHFLYIIAMCGEITDKVFDGLSIIEYEEE